MKHKHDQTFAGEDDVLIWAAVSTKAQDRYSIEDQLKMMRAWCAERGVNIVDELVVRGFSRDYWTLADVVAAAGSDEDMAAFAQLQAHIRRQSFTLFLCFDADRFGRTTSLVHEVIGRITRDCNARILTLFDNTVIDAGNAPMVGTLKALKAQQDVDKLKEYRETGMHNRARDGKSTAGTPPLFHKRVRDERGREIGLAVNEELRSLWTDLATVILRGVAWDQVEDVLFEEFKHGVNGEPYRWTYMRHLVHHPSFWGHAAINYRLKGRRSTKSSDPWIWDESVAPPPDITVYRNTQPAVYTGELAEKVKEELWRRHRLKGKARSASTYRFSGLLVCEQCGYTMTKAVSGQGQQIYMRCETQYAHRKRRGVVCDNTTYIKSGVIQEYFNKRLAARLRGDSTELFEFASQAEQNELRIREHEKQLAILTKRLNSLVEELADAPQAARPVFRQRIEETSYAIDRSTEALNDIRDHQLSDLALASSQARLLSTLKEHGVPWLWEQDETFIHQCLSAALAGNQLVILDGEIVGTHPERADRIRRKRRGSH